MRLYDRLFTDPAPDRGDADFLNFLNPDSLSVVDNARLEAGLAEARPEDRFQFERLGYFVADRFEHGNGRLVFNRTIGLRDVWVGRVSAGKVSAGKAAKDAQGNSP